MEPRTDQRLYPECSEVSHGAPCWIKPDTGNGATRNQFILLDMWVVWHHSHSFLLVCISFPTLPSFLFTAHERLSLLSLSFCSLSDIPLSNLLIQRANRTIITQIKVINSLQWSSFFCLSSTSYHQTLPLFQSQLFSLLTMPLKDTVPEEHFKSNKQLSSERESRAQATLKAHQRPE